MDNCIANIGSNGINNGTLNLIFIILLIIRFRQYLIALNKLKINQLKFYETGSDIFSKIEQE